MTRFSQIMFMCGLVASIALHSSDSNNRERLYTTANELYEMYQTMEKNYVDAGYRVSPFFEALNEQAKNLRSKINNLAHTAYGDLEIAPAQMARVRYQNLNGFVPKLNPAVFATNTEEASLAINALMGIQDNVNDVLKHSQKIVLEETEV